MIVCRVSVFKIQMHHVGLIDFQFHINSAHVPFKLNSATRDWHYLW